MPIDNHAPLIHLNLRPHETFNPPPKTASDSPKCSASVAATRKSDSSGRRKPAHVSQDCFSLTSIRVTSFPLFHHLRSARVPVLPVAEGGGVHIHEGGGTAEAASGGLHPYGPPRVFFPVASRRIESRSKLISCLCGSTSLPLADVS